MKNIIVKIDNKDYELNVGAAITRGILTEQKPLNIQLTPNEVELIKAVLNRVGGNPNGVRGYADSVMSKLRELDYIVPDLDFSLETDDAKWSLKNYIYFKN